MKVVGLTGYAGAGKDTVREVLCNAYGFAGLAFADPLRVMGEALLHDAGVPLCYARQRELKEVEIPGLGVSWRRLLQTLGTEWGRGLRESFWLDLAALKVETLVYQGLPGVVVSDVRFPNEADWIHSIGGEVWRVCRPDAQPVAAHVSEQHIECIAVDRLILNDGSLAQLCARVLAQDLA